MENAGIALHSIFKATGNSISSHDDALAVEKPLQIQLSFNNSAGHFIKNIAVTMRTPGNDDELAAGFLFTEGIINKKDAIAGISHPANDNNTIIVTLQDGIIPSLQQSERNFYTTSSCGICGKTSIEAIKNVSLFNDEINYTLKADTLYSLPKELLKQQELFESTGSIHASALFTSDGVFELLKEDVGRHNALDKLIGASLLAGQLPLYNKILLLSGRASFELIQKASMAGIKVIAAIGAPSTLAVELARENSITLVGFLRKNTMNIYSGSERIK